MHKIKIKTTKYEALSHTHTRGGNGVISSKLIHFVDASPWYVDSIRDLLVHRHEIFMYLRPRLYANVCQRSGGSFISCIKTRTHGITIMVAVDLTFR